MKAGIRRGLKALTICSPGTEARTFFDHYEDHPGANWVALANNPLEQMDHRPQLSRRRWTMEMNYDRSRSQ
jgi:hypothetical protein